MNWLYALVRGIVAALLGQAQENAEKPKVTTDANTPKPIRDELNNSVSEFDRMRDSKDGKH